MGKAFDKVDRAEMFKALERMQAHPQLINLVQQLYEDTQFVVEIQGVRCNKQTQQTGIRQGCQLSPCLFLIVMTVMFEDVNYRIEEELKKHRVPGTIFDEFTYADDTICFSTDTKTINTFIQEIEEEGVRYGLKLS